MSTEQPHRSKMSKMRQPTRIGGGLGLSSASNPSTTTTLNPASASKLPQAPPISLDKLEQTFKQSHFQKKYNFAQPKKEEINPDEINARFNKYFEGLNAPSSEMTHA